LSALIPLDVVPEIALCLVLCIEVSGRTEKIRDVINRRGDEE
jgi:hypothetical protein